MVIWVTEVTGSISSHLLSVKSSRQWCVKPGKLWHLLHISTDNKTISKTINKRFSTKKWWPDTESFPESGESTTVGSGCGRARALAVTVSGPYYVLQGSHIRNTKPQKHPKIAFVLLSINTEPSSAISCYSPNEYTLWCREWPLEMR